MRKLILVTLSLYLFSCASTNSESVIQDTAGDGAIQDVDLKPTMSAEPEKVEVKAPPPPIAVSMYAGLNDAIKSQNDEAIQKSSSEILTRNPKDLRALNALALVYYKKGRFEAAHFLLNKAIAAHPNSSELYGNLALVQLAKNERREAIKSMRKGLEINPQDSVIGTNLGAIYVEEKDYSKALLSLEIPIKKGSKDLKTLNNYAIALAANGKTKEAAEIYEKLLKDNVSQREVLLNYSILLIENMQKPREGLDLLNRLKFVGAPQESREVIKNLENKAKAGLQ